MKNDKNEKTPYIMKTTKHFNDVSVQCEKVQFLQCSPKWRVMCTVCW